MNSVHLIVSGRVQGVFFRASVRRKALELGLSGYAKNLADGSVDVVAQGDKAKIIDLIGFIKGNPGSSEVKDIKIKEKFMESLDGFKII